MCLFVCVCACFHMCNIVVSSGPSDSPVEIQSLTPRVPCSDRRETQHAKARQARRVGRMQTLPTERWARETPAADPKTAKYI